MSTKQPRFKSRLNEIHFISNNVKGFQSTNKILKLIKYFKDKIISNDILFFKETHSADNDGIKQKNYFEGEVYYSPVFRCFIGSDDRILTLDVDICDENFILINLYNHDIEGEQLKTLSKLMEMLTKLHLTQNNNIIYTGDINLLFNVKLENY